MTRAIDSFYVTFGVQYTNNLTNGEIHPQGMSKDGYAVIEAPDMEIARAIANAIFDTAYAFIYDWEDFMGDGIYDRWYAEGPGALLTIKWVQP